MGIASLEDKIVQQAVVTILNQIYEVDFRGFSYGFRPGRDPHQALDALNVGIARRKVNWILDADIKGFFDHVSHEWLERFLQHRIADTRVLRLIQKWMKAGVLEEGEWSETEQGTPQGAVISPLLANVYLHYVFDLWAEVWREKVVPTYWPGGVRCRAGVSLIRAFVRNLRTWLALLREKAQAVGTARLKVPMGQPGTDCSVVAENRGNARGAKGAGHPHRDRKGQRATGGTRWS